MVVTGFAFIALRNLFAVVMLSGIFSLTAAVLYVQMDAVDVAFTEAAVGAGIATVLGLATLGLIGVTDEKRSERSHLGSFIVKRRKRSYVQEKIFSHYPYFGTYYCLPMDFSSR